MAPEGYSIWQVSGPKTELLGRAPSRPTCASLTAVPGGSALPAMAGKEQQSPGLAQSGQGQPCPRKQARPFASFTRLPPTHRSAAICHDLFMLPLLTASRYGEANFTGSKLSHCRQRQKTPPDGCPPSMPAYQSFLNKTTQINKNATLPYTQPSGGNDLSKALALQGDPCLF